MGNNLLQGKRGVISGALDDQSIAWKIAERCVEEGATITLEPSMEVQPGYMLVHEENIVIRDGLPQLLTKRAPRQMMRI